MTLFTEWSSDNLNVRFPVKLLHGFNFSLQIFAETVELGIALLEGGNQEIQKSIFKQLTGMDASVGQSFFKVFYETMIEAQAEIKSTVTVNTSDIAAKAQEDIPGTTTTTQLALAHVGFWCLNV